MSRSLIVDKLPRHILRSFKYARILFIIAFGLIILRLWYLQVMRGDYFRNRSENNRLRTRYIPAPRGLIFDRNGKVLVRNRPSFNLEIIIEDTNDVKSTINKLADILSLDPKVLFDQLSESKVKRRRFEPQLLIRDMDRDLLAKVLAHKYELPGITSAVVPAREYIFGNYAAHLIGYVREINAQQLQENFYVDYHSGDIVGHFGIEKEQEYYLQGKRGVQGVIVNATGNRIEESYMVPEQAGHNIYLTLDYALQSVAEKLLKDKRGVLLLMDSKSGEILTMVSKPDYDPNQFSNGISSKEWEYLIERPFNRLSNRAVNGLYPPGSVFKSIVALAGLIENQTDMTRKVFCPGYFDLGKSARFRCHKNGGHGHVDLVEALAHSCNVYFYDLGLKLGIDNINKYATAFGFGQKTGIGLMQEASGTVPSTAWKKNTFSKPEDQRWYAGETPSVAVGQGALQVTPIQVARAYAGLANRGILPTPTIVREVRSQSGSYKDIIEKPKSEILPFQKEVYDKILKGLEAVVSSGTGTRARVLEELGIGVAGKTGTAQLRSYSDISKLPKKETLAWFAGFAPAHKPEVVVVAILEEGGHGGEAAAPLAGKLLEAYFSDKN
jgi:penicillin-binding protein 2